MECVGTVALANGFRELGRRGATVRRLRERLVPVALRTAGRADAGACNFRFQAWNAACETPSFRQNATIDMPLERCLSSRCRH